MLDLFKCSDWKNPYLDQTASKAVLKSLSVKDSGTVSIFCRESIEVDVYLREYLKYYSLKIKNNNYWTDTTIYSDSISQNKTIFTFSFFDTGWQNIKLTSYRFTGDSVVEVFKIYAASPLNQKSLAFNAGDTVVLSTAPVSENVLYNWMLFDGKQLIKDITPTTKFVADMTPVSSSGKLYVTNRVGNSIYTSPSFVFSIKPRTLQSLKITCEDDNIINDTISVATKSYDFIAKVTGASEIKSCTFNSKPFNVTTLTDGFLLDSTINVDNHSSSPLRIIISVTDNLNRSIQDTFYLKFIQKSSYIKVLNDIINQEFSLIHVNQTIPSLTSFYNIRTSQIYNKPGII